MRRIPTRVVAASLSLIVLAVTFGVARPATAHGLCEMYCKANSAWPTVPRVWSSPTRMAVRIETESSLSTSMVNRIVSNAAFEIDRQGRSLNFTYAGPGTSPHMCTSGNTNDNSLYLGHPALASNVGETTVCRNSNGSIKRFWIEFNMDAPWYTGTGVFSSGGRPSRSEYDFWSTATHELMHGGGWVVHFAEADDAFCPNVLEQPSRQTMCSGQIPGGTAQRTLADHDLHTFVKAY